MAHFTELDENNIVIRTIVVNDAYILDSDGRESDSVGAAWCRNHFGQVDSAVWIQTSFNGNIRKQYAEPGFKYDAVADEFVRPQPYPSWTLDSNNDWQPPEISQQIRAIFLRYTELIEPLSLDEAYLDVSECTKCHGSATLIAEAIRRDIYNELNLTASAGVAPVKFLAKVASDMNKPNGQYVIPPEKVQEEVDKLPLEKIPGVGKVSLEKLHQAGFFVGADIKNSDYREVLKRFGKLGASLWNKSHGIDNRAVVVERERKSVGVERTFSENISSYDECWQVIEERLFPELERRLTKASPEKAIIKQGIKLKFADFQLTTIEHIHSELELDYFKELLRDILKRQNGREIRLLGLSVMLKPEEQAKQLSFF